MSPQRHASRRRRRSRGRFSLLFKVLAAAAILAALTLGVTVFFQLEKVEVEGNVRYSAEEIIAASGLEIGDNLFRINKNSIASDIREKLPYVEGVTPVRQLPNTMVIVVQEWDAAARVVSSPSSAGELEEGEEPSSETWLISVNGKLLEKAPEDSQAILVSGLTLLSPRAGTQMAVPLAQETKLESLKQLLAAMEELEMLDSFSTIDLSAAAQITLTFNGRFTVKLPMTADFNYKLRALREVAPDWETYEGGTFDLTQEQYTVGFSPE